MASEVGIANRALQKMGAKSIVSLTEDSKPGREMNSAYAPLRDAELQAYPWIFSKHRVQLSPDTTTPAFGFGYQYQLPSDFLRIVKHLDDNNYEIEGRMLLTDQGTAWNLIYCRRITDVNSMDPLFRELLASRIALDNMETFTQSKSKKEDAERKYFETLSLAKKTNAIMRQAQGLPSTSWNDTRL